MASAAADPASRRRLVIVIGIGCSSRFQFLDVLAASPPLEASDGFRDVAENLEWCGAAANEVHARIAGAA
jgi:hypothetical protein